MRGTNWLGLAKFLNAAIELLRKYTVNHTMRHLMLILMIALLPLRGWAADGMAVFMAAQQLVAIENVAYQAQETGADSPFDAELRVSMPANCIMQMAQSHTPDIGSAQVGHGCNACQLCMAVVTGYPTLPISTLTPPPVMQRTVSISFTSAERAPGFKPPIF